MLTMFLAAFILFHRTWPTCKFTNDFL